MDGYLQTALVGNSVITPQPNRTSHLTKLLKPCPPSNKEFNCDHFHTVEGTYHLVHDIHFDTIAPQFSVGTRATILNTKTKTSSTTSSSTANHSNNNNINGNHYSASSSSHKDEKEDLDNDEGGHGNDGDDDVDNNNNSEGQDESDDIPMQLDTRNNSTPFIVQHHSHQQYQQQFSPLLDGITRSTALPIPNVTSRSYDVCSSPPHPSFQPAHDTLTPPRTTPISSIPTITSIPSPANHPATTPTPTSSTPFHPLDDNSPATSASSSGHHDNSHHPQSHAHHNSHNNHHNSNSSTNGIHTNGIADLSSSVSSLSALFSRRNSVRFLHSPQRKPKNNLVKTKSSFVLRIIIHDRLAHVLANRTIDDGFLFFNLGTSFLWMDAKGKPKDPLSRIVFTKAFPTCHDVNPMTKCNEHLDVIIGFSSGDCVWYDPLTSKYFRLNKDGNMKRGSVTNVKWLPGSEDLFMASFADGTILILDKDREDQAFNVAPPSTWAEQQFQATRPHKSQKYNPVSHWSAVEKGIGTFAFSPDGIHLAVVGKDGTLRIIDYLQERLLDIFTSYYGNFLCVAWSPDGRYLLTGGQDDLVTIWGFTEKRIVARCQGHKSWVTQVAFDPYRCDDKVYRFGSVGEDCKIILWDFSFSALHRPKNKHRSYTATTPKSARSPKDRFSFVGAEAMKRSPMLAQMFDRLSTYEPTAAVAVTTATVATATGGGGVGTEHPHSPTSRTFRYHPPSPPPPTPTPAPPPPTPQRLHTFGFRKRSSTPTSANNRKDNNDDHTTHNPPLHYSPLHQQQQQQQQNHHHPHYHHHVNVNHRLHSPSSPTSKEFLTAFETYHSAMPTLHPAPKKTQVPLLQPSTVRTVHADPCVDLIFRQDGIVTTDRRGRIRTWGRP